MVGEQDRSVNRRRWACAVAAAVFLAPTTLSIVSLGVRSLQQPWWFGRSGVGFFALSGGIAGVIRVVPLVAFALFYAVRPEEGRSTYWLLPAVFAAYAVADVVLTVGLLPGGPPGLGALSMEALSYSAGRAAWSSFSTLVHGAMAVWLWTARPTVGESV